MTTNYETQAQAAQAAYRIGGVRAIQVLIDDRTPETKTDASYIEEAILAAVLRGWHVVDTRGVSDYQGWGCLLLKREIATVWLGPDLIQTEWGWGTLHWSYGSCGGCCEYADMDEVHRIEALGDIIDVWRTEEEARIKFAEGGW